MPIWGRERRRPRFASTEKTRITTVQAYLTDKIGTGATAADVLATGSFAYPNVNDFSEQDVTALSNLSLGPGTYYFVLYNPGSYGAWWGSSASATKTTAPGVTILSEYYSNGGNLNSLVPYASNLRANKLGMHFSITGTNAVPEPSSALLVVIGLSGIAAVGLRRKFSQN